MMILRCVIPGYSECAAKIEAACICNKMPLRIYLKAYREKYGAEELLRHLGVEFEPTPPEPRLVVKNLVQEGD